MTEVRIRLFLPYLQASVYEKVHLKALTAQQESFSLLMSAEKGNIPLPFDLKSSSSRLISCSFHATFPLSVDVRPLVVGGLQCLSAVIAFVVIGCLACRRVLEATLT
jgi:hypothetical protein